GERAVRAFAREDQAQQDRVGLQLARQEDRALRRVGLADDGDPGLALEAAADPGPQQVVIVDEEDPDRQRASATSSVARVPPAGSGANSRRPPERPAHP